MPRVMHGLTIMFGGPQFATDPPDDQPDEDNLDREHDQHSDEPPDLSSEEIDQRIEMAEVELKMLHALRNGDRVAARRWAEVERRLLNELGSSNGEDEGGDDAGH